MTHILNALDLMNFLWVLWLFFLVFALHELEEWNIHPFEHRNFVGSPPAATNRSVHFWIGFVILIGLIWAAIATLPGNPTFAAWVLLPAIAIMVQNALQHIYWSIYFKQYAPGVITAILLLIPLGCYISARALAQGYTPIWYVAIWAAFVLLGVVQTIMAGNKMTSIIRGINNIGVWLSDRIK